MMANKQHKNHEAETSYQETSNEIVIDDSTSYKEVDKKIIQCFNQREKEKEEKERECLYPIKINFGIDFNLAKIIFYIKFFIDHK